MKILTTDWAEKELPDGVELVQAAGRWYLITWTEKHVIATPDPQKWCWANRISDFALERLVPWVAPDRELGTIVESLTAQMATSESGELH